jgi:hypothetical protein
MTRSVLPSIPDIKSLIGTWELHLDPRSAFRLWVEARSITPHPSAP